MADDGATWIARQLRIAIGCWLPRAKKLRSAKGKPSSTVQRLSRNYNNHLRDSLGTGDLQRHLLLAYNLVRIPSSLIVSLALHRNMTNPSQDTDCRFHISFSFAGPHRGKVREIASLVSNAINPGIQKRSEGQVFFDEWFEHEILGSDMDVLLQRIYLEQSLMVVADLSDDYADRRWPRAEAKAIRALRFQIDSAGDEAARLRLINIRFDQGSVPGIFETEGYLDGNKSSADLAQQLLARFGLLCDRLKINQDQEFEAANHISKENETTIAKAATDISLDSAHFNGNRLRLIARRFWSWLVLLFVIVGYTSWQYFSSPTTRFARPANLDPPTTEIVADQEIWKELCTSAYQAPERMSHAIFFPSSQRNELTFIEDCIQRLTALDIDAASEGFKALLYDGLAGCEACASLIRWEIANSPNGTSKDRDVAYKLCKSALDHVRITRFTMRPAGALREWDGRNAALEWTSFAKVVALSALANIEEENRAETIKELKSELASYAMFWRLNPPAEFPAIKLLLKQK